MYALNFILSAIMGLGERMESRELSAWITKQTVTIFRKPCNNSHFDIKSSARLN